MLKLRHLFLCSVLLLLAVCQVFAAPGDINWGHEAVEMKLQEGTAVTTPAVAPDGTIFVGTADGVSKFDRRDGGDLQALDPVTGALKWSYMTMGDVVGTPVATSDGSVYFVSTDNNLYSVKPPATPFGTNGIRNWVYPLVFTGWDNPSGLALGLNDSVYVAAKNVVKFDREGNLLWTSAISSDGDTFSHGPVVSTGGSIFVTSGTTLYALDADGNVDWSFANSGTIGSLSLTDGDKILLGGSDNTLNCLLPNGQLLWTFYTSSPVFTTAVTAPDGTIYFGAWDYKLYAVTQAGDLQWEYDSSWPLFGAPAVGSDGTVYFFTPGDPISSEKYDGDNLDPAKYFGARVVALDGDGSFLWSLPFGAGNLYVGQLIETKPILSNDGHLYVSLTSPQNKAVPDDPYTLKGFLLSVEVSSPQPATSSWPLFRRDNFNSANAKIYPPVFIPASITVPTVDADGDYSVTWAASLTTGATYVLEESLDPAFSVIANSFAVVGNSYNLLNTPPPDEVYYYRVKAVKPGYTDSSWRVAANGCAVNAPVLDEPASISVPATDADGTYVVSWGAVSTLFSTYVLEESKDPGFGYGVTVVYGGQDASVTLTDRPNGTYFYRVKATKQDYADTAWVTGSNGCEVQIVSVVGPGEIAWSYQAGLTATSTTNPALAFDGSIYFGADDGKLYSLNSNSSFKWSYQTGGAILGTPVAARGGTVYAVSNDKNLYALTSAGVRLWAAPLGFSSWENSGGIGLSSDGEIYVAARNLLKFDTNGNLLWSSQLASSGGTFSAGPVIGTNALIYVSSGADLYAFAADGSSVWTFANSAAITSLSITDGDRILIGSVDNRLTCVSSGGELQWRFYTGGSVLSTAVTAADGTIYFGANDDRLYAIDQSGGFLWEYLSEGDITGAPAIGSDNIIYFLTGGDPHRANAVDSTGTLLWTLGVEADEQLTGRSPLLSNTGVLYVAMSTLSPPARLLAFKINSPDVADSRWPLFGRDIFNSFNAKQYPIVLSPPAITVPLMDADGNDIIISWSASPPPAVDQYVVEESTDAAFTAPTVVYSGGTATSVTLNGRAPGTYYYRVKALRAGYSESDWRVGANGCAVSIVDDKLRWAYELAYLQQTGTAVTTPAVAPDGTVFVGSDDGYLHALDPSGPTTKWSYFTNGKIVGAPVATSEGSVYFVSADKNLYVVRADGSRRWVHPLDFDGWDNPGGLALGVNDEVFVAAKQLLKFSKDGELLWTGAVSSETGSFSHGPVVSTNGNIYVASGNTLYAFTSGGALGWSYENGGEVLELSLTEGDKILVNSGDNRLTCLSDSGEWLWDFYTPGAVSSTAVTGPDGTIYFGATDQKLYALSQEGAYLWHYSSAGSIKSAPAVGNDGVIYFFNSGEDVGLDTYKDDGNGAWIIDPEWIGATITAIDTNRNLVWSLPFTVGMPIFGELGGNSPILSNSGMLYASLTEPQPYPDSVLSVENIQVKGYLVAVEISSLQAATSSWPMFRRDNFNSGNAKILPPVFIPSSITVPATDADGDYSVAWGASLTPGATYVLEESLDPAFSVIVNSYAVAGTSQALTGRAQNVYYYRVKAVKAGYLDSSWRVAGNGCNVNGASLTMPSSITVPANSSDGNISISWGATSSPYATYVLEESKDPAFGFGVTVVYRGTAIGATLTGRPDGIYFYRVKATQLGYADTSWQPLVSGTANRCIVEIIELQGPGDVDWSYAAGAQSSELTNPALDSDGNVYFGADDDYFYALEPDGDLRWKYLTSGAVVGTPVWSDNGTAALADDAVYFVSADKNLYALTPGGVRKWVYPLAFTSWSNPGGIALGSAGDLYVAADALSKFAPNGTLVWTNTAASAISSGPVIGADGNVYAASGNTLYAVDANGNTVWTYLNSGAITSISVTGAGSQTSTVPGNILIGSVDNRLSCIASTGELQWRFYTSAPVNSTAVTGIDGTIYFGSDDNKLYAVNQSGEFLWEHTADGDIFGAPAIGSDGLLYFFSAGATHKINAFNLTTRETVWSSALDNEERLTGKSPLLSRDNLLYAGLFTFNSPVKLLAVKVASPDVAESSWPLFGRDISNSFNARMQPIVPGPTVLSPSVITVPATDVDGNGIVISWSASATPAVDGYIVEESTDAAFTAPTVVYNGTNLSVTLNGRTAGSYYYRVKAIKADYADSDWQAAANGCFVGLLGSIIINEDVVYTKEKQVRLLMTYAPYFKQYRLKTDGNAWGPWVAMPSTEMERLAPSHKLGGKDGEKTVSVQFSSGTLLYSDVYSDTIVLDRKKPKAVINQVTAASSSTLSLTIDASDDLSGVNMMQFSMDKADWTAWEAFMPSKVLPWQPAAGLKKVFVRVMDGAGNISKAAKIKIPVQ